MAFEIFTHGFSFLNLLSILAFFTTVGLFFCGIPICRQILKRKDTKEIAAAPFLMGILGGTCWLTYGYLKKDYTVMVVTSTQVVLYSSYTIFYWFMTKNKLWITLKVLLIVSLCSAIGAATIIFQKKVFHPLGILCMTLNAADFAAPLAGLKTVIRRGATSTLPLPLCMANFMVSTEWFVYGLLVWDFYLITPNGIGSVLSLSQVLIFIVLPRKPGQQSPIRRLLNKIKGNSVKDIEQSAVVAETVSPADILEEGKEGKECEKETSWSSRVLSNLEQNLDDVISKVTKNDQFAYTKELNETDSENEKTITDPKVLQEMMKTKRTERQSVRCERKISSEDETAAKVHRSASSPDLSNA